MKLFVWKVGIKGEVINDPTAVRPPAVVAIPYAVPYYGSRRIASTELLKILLDRGLYVAISTSYDERSFVILTYDEKGIGKPNIEYSKLPNISGQGFGMLQEVAVWYSAGIHPANIVAVASSHLRDVEMRFSAILRGSDKINVKDGVLQNGNDYLRKIGVNISGTFDRQTLMSKLKSMRL